MRKRHRSAWSFQHVAYFLGVRRLRNRPTLVVEIWDLPNISTRMTTLNGIITGSCDRTFTITSQRPALIGEAIEAIVVTENEMVEQSDAQ